MSLEGPARPRRTIHRGVVEASAIYVDASIVGARRASLRAVAAWVPGATVHRVGSALLVRLPSPRWIDSRSAPGLPLVRLGAPPGSASAPAAPLSSAPLDADELAKIHPPPGSALLVAGGVARTIEDGAPIEPVDLLDVSAFALLEVTSLGVAPPAPALRPATVVSRALFGVASAPPESAQLLTALTQRKPASSRSAVRLPGDVPRAEAGVGLSIVVGFFAAMAALLERFAGAAPSRDPAPPRLPASAAGAGSQRGLAAVPQEPRGPSLADRARARIMHWFVRALVRARLAAMIGRRQSEYLDETMDMFERGDLAEALRRAVPLARDKGLEGLVTPSLTVPTPRSALTIAPAQSASSTAMFADGDFFSRLRATYRKAFEQLERQGRIDEAAFVLAELLHADGEAVSFLERHGRLRLAAEVAEARNLPPGLVVRQWLLAGDTARAIHLARRFGAFADALARLENHQDQPRLRLLWADTLADAGDYAAAVDVVWPHPESRRLGIAWIDAAIDQGGDAGARMLARKLELLPGAFPEVRERALQMLEGGEASALPERIAFAQALLKAPATPASRTLARPTIRALVCDGARTAEPVVAGLVRSLVEHAADASLRADLPAWPVVVKTPLRALAPAREITLAAADTGPSQVHDFVELPGGRAVIALGEAGVRVLGRDGRALVHLDQPAHRLVISDRGDRALALARRGDVWRIARLDLWRRRSSTWCDAELDAFAPDFDGSQWIVARRGDLHVIDALDDRLAALRTLPIAGRALTIGRTQAECSVITQDDDVKRWRYELPSFTLRGCKPIRDASTLGAVDVGVAGASGAAGALLQRVTPDAPPPARPSVQLVFASETTSNGTTLEVAPEHAVPLAVEVGPGFVATVTREEQSVVVRLLDDSSLDRRLIVTLTGARRARARLLGDALAVSDDRGRLITLDLAHGGVLRSQRV